MKSPAAQLVTNQLNRFKRCPSAADALDRALTPVRSAALIYCRTWLRCSHFCRDRRDLCRPPSPEQAAYLAAFARFLHRNVASRDAADDTRATYAVHVATWLAWCRGTELDISRVTLDDVEDYREALIAAGCQPV
jgi:hypothetical protein